MSSDHNPSAADEKELQEKEERACQIEDLKKRIEGLENVNKKLADQNLELLRAYEQQRFGVPSGVGDTNDTTREFERLGIQESVENFHQKEKDVDSLNAKCEMLEKANLNLTEENKKLTKDLEHNKKLNTKSKKVAIFNVTLQAENKMLRETLEHYKDVEKDYKDGANMAEEKKIPNQMASESGKGKREIFVWKQRHEDFLLREIVVVEPHQFRSGSKERGAAWTTIAENLKAFDMKVSQRSVRKRFEKILKEFKAKESKEARASGLDVEYTERDKILTDIVERMKECEEAMEKVKGKEKKDRESAEEMRKRATERLGETRQRHDMANDAALDAELESDEGILVTPEKRRRRSNGDVMKILEQSLAAKRNEHKESTRLRERGITMMESQVLSQQQFQRTLLEQQQQFQQQQQNVTFAIVTALSELVKNIRK